MPRSQHARCGPPKSSRPTMTLRPVAATMASVTKPIPVSSKGGAASRIRSVALCRGPNQGPAGRPPDPAGSEALAVGSVATTSHVPCIRTERRPKPNQRRCRMSARSPGDRHAASGGGTRSGAAWDQRRGRAASTRSDKSRQHVGGLEGVVPLEQHTPYLLSFVHGSRRESLPCRRARPDLGTD